MSYKTLQEVFNIAASGILAQGKKSTRGGGSCLYRGPSGTKCAVGFLIKDEAYRPFIEGVHVGGIQDILRASGISDDSRTISLLRDLQHVHDRHAVENWPKRLIIVAIDYDLDPIVVSEFTRMSVSSCTGHLENPELSPPTLSEYDTLQNK